MAIASGIGHFFQSIIEVFQGLLAAVANFFQLIVDTAIGVLQGVVGLFEGVVSFVLNNFFIIGTGAAAIFAYLLYSQRQGTTPVSRSIKNKSS
ncbi:hypothetical protein M426DRAFT_16572 [Hypoxylon sp. CI-4A]|nr:hypothetical protein M426DRAFT_16572 [Hypoxylon sp. CI-4A]